MVRVEAVLREFAVWLSADAPEVAAVRNLQRAHIERYKRHLATRSKASKGSTRNSSNESAPICPNMGRSAWAGQTLGKSEPSL
jgi:hypothetical protein